MAEGGRDERTSFGGLAKSHKKYGSTSNNTKKQEIYTKHTVVPGDTLQGIALKYGVTTEQIRRVNKIWMNDSLFLRPTLNIPVPKDSIDNFTLDNGDSSPVLSCLDYSNDSDLQSEQNLKSNVVLLQDENAEDSEVDKSEQTVADILIRIDSAIAQSRNKVKKMEQNPDFHMDEYDNMNVHHRTPSLRTRQSLLRASSDPNVAPHPVVMTQGRKVRTSLQRLEREQDEMFEL